MSRRPSAALLVAALVVLAACGQRPTLGEPAIPASPPMPPTTVPPTTVPPTTVPPTTVPPTTVAPTTVVAPDRSGGVFAIGDSVMQGAVPAIEKGLPGSTVDALQNRSFGNGLQVVKKRKAAGSLPANVIVHLGNNGTVTASQCDQLMDVLAGKHVVLVTLKVPRDWEAPNNLVLTACAARHGAVLADWHSLALEHPTALYKDGIHLRPPEGPLVYTGLLDRST